MEKIIQNLIIINLIFLNKDFIVHLTKFLFIYLFYLLKL